MTLLIFIFVRTTQSPKLKKSGRSKFNNATLKIGKRLIRSLAPFCIPFKGCNSSKLTRRE